MRLCRSLATTMLLLAVVVLNATGCSYAYRSGTIQQQEQPDLKARPLRRVAVSLDRWAGMTDETLEKLERGRPQPLFGQNFANPYEYLKKSEFEEPILKSFDTAGRFLRIDKWDRSGDFRVRFTLRQEYRVQEPLTILFLLTAGLVPHKSIRKLELQMTIENAAGQPVGILERDAELTVWHHLFAFWFVSPESRTDPVTSAAISDMTFRVIAEAESRGYWDQLAPRETITLPPRPEEVPSGETPPPQTSGRRFEPVYPPGEQPRTRVLNQLGLHGGFFGTAPVTRQSVMDFGAGPSIGFSAFIFDLDAEGLFGEAKDKFKGFGGGGIRFRVYGEPYETRQRLNRKAFDPYFVTGLSAGSDFRAVDWNLDGDLEHQDMGFWDVGFGIERKHLFAAGNATVNPYLETLLMLSDKTGERGNTRKVKLTTDLAFRFGFRIRSVVLD